MYFKPLNMTETQVDTAYRRARAPINWLERYHENTRYEHVDRAVKWGMCTHTKPALVRLSRGTGGDRLNDME